MPLVWNDDDREAIATPARRPSPRRCWVGTAARRGSRPGPRCATRAWLLTTPARELAAPARAAARLRGSVLKPGRARAGSACGLRRGLNGRRDGCASVPAVLTGRVPLRRGARARPSGGDGCSCIGVRAPTIARVTVRGVARAASARATRLGLVGDVEGAVRRPSRTSVPRRPRRGFCAYGGGQVRRHAPRADGRSRARRRRRSCGAHSLARAVDDKVACSACPAARPAQQRSVQSTK